MDDYDEGEGNILMELNNKSFEKENFRNIENIDSNIVKPIFKEDEGKLKELNDILKTEFNLEKIKTYIESFNLIEKNDGEKLKGFVQTLDSVEGNLENLDSEKLDDLREKYPKLDNMLNSIEDKLQNLENASEEDKEKLKKGLDQQIKRFKGYLVEALLKESLAERFKEISDVELQKETSDGKTNIDITCRDAKEDFTIGDTEVKKGEDLYIESKIGNKEYIASQMEHMKKQIEGHHNAGSESENGYKSVIVVSADYKEISEEKRNDFEKHLKEVGTDLVVLDKTAENIDYKVKSSI